MNYFLVVIKIRNVISRSPRVFLYFGIDVGNVSCNFSEDEERERERREIERGGRDNVSQVMCAERVTPEHAVRWRIALSKMCSSRFRTITVDGAKGYVFSLFLSFSLELLSRLQCSVVVDYCRVFGRKNPKSTNAYANVFQYAADCATPRY